MNEYILDKALKEFGDAVRQAFKYSMTSSREPDSKRGLTLHQQLALPAIQWLLFGARATGRSTVLAHAYIEQAIATREWVHVGFNHHDDTHRGKDFLFGTIETEMSARYPDYTYFRNRSNDCIRVVKR